MSYYRASVLFVCRPKDSLVREKPLRPLLKARNKMPKEIRKTIRFSDEEYSKIEKMMNEHNLTFAEFARGAILKKKIKTNLTKEMIFEVNKIGNNLNQIAKSVNSKDRKNVLLKLIEIQNDIKKMSDVY